MRREQRCYLAVTAREGELVRWKPRERPVAAEQGQRQTPGCRQLPATLPREQQICLVVTQWLGIQLDPVRAHELRSSGDERRARSVPPSRLADQEPAVAADHCGLAACALTERANALQQPAVHFVLALAEMRFDDHCGGGHCG